MYISINQYISQYIKRVRLILDYDFMVHILITEVADFRFCGRFPGGAALAASLSTLSPGSKARTNPLGVAAFTSIS